MTNPLPNLSPEVDAISDFAAGRSAQPLRILVLSITFPSSIDPTRGVFVKERVRALADLPNCDVRVLAPVPWFPPIKQFSRWYKWSQYPREEVVDGLQVYRPQYVLPPKVGGYFHPRLMYPAAKRAADKLRKSFDFDLIDSHFVYPSGVVGAMLGRVYNVPVVMTGRGEDMLRFPQYPLKGPSIRWALGRASHCVALSSEIAAAMKKNGADSNRISVIPNGIDTNKFRPLPQAECRQQLKLPQEARIILSVGDRLKLKGFHLLVEAMPKILAAHPTALLVIVGGPGRHGRDYTAEIETRITGLGLSDNVRLVGPRPHDELPKWYNAADLYALLSSREGSPNVLIEALACGTPAVATRVGGAADEFTDPVRGILLESRTAEQTASCVNTALGRDWDSSAIRKSMEKRSWHGTASSVVRQLRDI